MSVNKITGTKQVVMIDTSCANVSSLKFAIERLGYEVLVSADISVINSAEKVLLPGVGSAAAAMQQIQQKGLLDCIRGLTQPVLGICLGMQLLTNRSEEANATADYIECLGLVDTEVNAMKSDTLRLPHMGWNQVKVERDTPLFHGIDDNSYFYFVHGYCVPKGEHTLASCDYTKPFSAAIQNGNFMGVQFHPERSSEAGAQLLRNFVELV
ncbi:imidazole glycerol phosphate synthase subunit HisH [Paraneptunicella aestuarii]|uniref:imidazole glycerol phosphate synthase subunit HisH n=1 Tax=Paraneptunicella aestuarii TaxID=2831148 RepID=UPI001E554855|nr:imidazole glycerol phosphate synthase subunit HisH [Paraneptunicella aestuarii]UAA37745.1 imidazole glycerol phosphate synthase subunit HisH [Paraneptunicella aestuarii]